MGSARNILKSRKKALDDIERLLGNPENLYAIHYSCESFIDIKDGRSPRITSIAILNVGTRQAISFSIHQMAERKRYEVAAIESHCDELEKMMLDDFYKYVETHPHARWLHWNMRDINYGFSAISHRYIVLGGQPISIHENNCYDLARILKAIYGPLYISHPRMKSLVEKNGITDKSFLDGPQEANAFNNREYIALHQSTLRKVNIITTIAEMIWNNSLQTDTTWKDKYGINVAGVIEMISDHWFFKLLGFVAILITIFGPILHLF